MAKKTNTYPEWAEKFRGKGRTIRKVRDGFALYECTSEYVPGGYPKSKQKYLGMVTEKDGFIPKKDVGSGACYMEYGMSRLAALNFRRDAMRHVFQCSEDLFQLGVIHFVFGGCDAVYISSSYLTCSNAAHLIEVCGKVKPGKVERVSGVINEAFKQKVASEGDRELLRNLLMLCVVEKGPRSVRKPEIPVEARRIMDSAGLKHDE